MKNREISISRVKQKNIVFNKQNFVYLTLPKCMRTFQIEAEVGRWAVRQSMKESQPNAKRCCQPTHREPCWHLWCPVPVVSSRHMIAAASLFQSPLECVCIPRHTWWSILCAAVRYTHACQTRKAEKLAWSFHKYSKVSLRKKWKAIHIHLALGVYSKVCYCSYSKYSKWCSLGCWFQFF